MLFLGVCFYKLHKSLWFGRKCCQKDTTVHPSCKTFSWHILSARARSRRTQKEKGEIQFRMEDRRETSFSLRSNCVFMPDTSHSPSDIKWEEDEACKKWDTNFIKLSSLVREESLGASLMRCWNLRGDGFRLMRNCVYPFMHFNSLIHKFTEFLARFLNQFISYFMQNSIHQFT